MLSFMLFLTKCYFSVAFKLDQHIRGYSTINMNWVVISLLSGM